jgi:hypothetical protein
MDSELPETPVSFFTIEVVVRRRSSSTLLPSIPGYMESISNGAPTTVNQLVGTLLESYNFEIGKSAGPLASHVATYFHYSTLRAKHTEQVCECSFPQASSIYF